MRWSSRGDKLASYDSWGKINIWRNRANILSKEFQISTAVSVTDMQWSPCGYYLILCGKEGHVQMISGINGITFFSIQVEATLHHSGKTQFTCCTWNKPGSRVALGTEAGEVVLMDPNSNGRSISTVILRRDVPIQSLGWFGPITDCTTRSGELYQSQSLSAYHNSGSVLFLTNVSNPRCFCSETGVHNGKMAWNSSETLLAVVGFREDHLTAVTRFLDSRGIAIFTLCDAIPSQVCTILHGLNHK